MQRGSDSHKRVKEEKRKSYSLLSFLAAQVSQLKRSVTNVGLVRDRELCSVCEEGGVLHTVFHLQTLAV